MNYEILANAIVGAGGSRKRRRECCGGINAQRNGAILPFRMVWSVDESGRRVAA